MRKCIITLTPDNETKADVQTGGVKDIEILDSLNNLMKHFAKNVINEANQIIGKDYSHLDGYLDFLRKNKM